MYSNHADPICFYFKLRNPYRCTIEVPIPKENTNKISYDYFYKELAKQCNVNPRNIKIGEIFYTNSAKNVVIDPTDFVSDSAIFPFSIINY